MRNFIFSDPEWSYEGYDWSDFAERSAAVAQSLDARNPDLSSFRASGGKLIIVDEVPPRRFLPRAWYYFKRFWLKLVVYFVARAITRPLRDLPATVAGLMQNRSATAVGGR